MSGPVALRGAYLPVPASNEPILPQSIITLTLPSTSTFSLKSRTSRRITNSVSSNSSTTPQTPEDQDSFRNRHIAIASSIFFRQTGRYPRSILWRLLSDQETLELRCVDLTKGKNQVGDPYLVIRLVFPSKVREEGIALADSENGEALHLFVATASSELYTFNLSPQIFIDPAVSEKAFDECLKVSKPNALAVSSLVRLNAVSSTELLGSLADGRTSRLTRGGQATGSEWVETLYGDGQWASSLRSLIKWQSSTSSVRYKGINFSNSAAVAISRSPHGKHIIAVTLSHFLRVWNIESGALVSSIDLLDRQRDPKDSGRAILHPSANANLFVFQSRKVVDGDEYYALTYSPLEGGAFKVWAFRDADVPEDGIRDLFGDEILRLPETQDGSLWNLSGVEIHTSEHSKEVDIWLYLRLNQRVKVFMRRFSSVRDIGQEWMSGWATLLESESSSLQPADSNGDLSVSHLNELWNRNSVPSYVLESALAFLAKEDSPRASAQSLDEKLNSYLSTRPSKKQKGEQPPRQFDQVAAKALMSTVVSLNTPRLEPVGFAYDHDLDLPWLLYSDVVAPIRAATRNEIISLNPTVALEGDMTDIPLPSIEDSDHKSNPIEEARLLEVAFNFRSSFSADLLNKVEAAIDSELWATPVEPALERCRQMYEDCDLMDEITQPQLELLESDLAAVSSTGEPLRLELLLALLNGLPKMMPKASTLLCTSFGKHCFANGAREYVASRLEQLKSLFTLVIFILAEPELSAANVEGSSSILLDVFHETRRQLQFYTLTEWLASRLPETNAEKLHGASNGTTNGTTNGLAKSKWTPRKTWLESRFVGVIHPKSSSDCPAFDAVLDTIESVLAYTWGAGDVSLDDVLVNTFSQLVRENNIELASRFQNLLPMTAIACYVRGRFEGLRKNFDAAMSWFKRAAPQLSGSTREGSHYAEVTSDLIDAEQVQSFANGIINFYDHIFDFFDPVVAPEACVEAARFALHFERPHGSTWGQCNKISEKLFHAALQLPDYTNAYIGLSLCRAETMQRPMLETFINKLITTGNVELLLSLPFANLKEQVDLALAAHATKEAASQSHSLIGRSANRIGYYKVLYAWRMQQNDFKGAAAVLIQRIKARNSLIAQRKHRFTLRSLDASLDDYLLGINALSLHSVKSFTGKGEGLSLDDKESLALEEGWVIVEDPVEGKRSVVTLHDLRLAYQAEIDRKGNLENGRFGIIGIDDDADAIDIDGEDEDMPDA